MQSVLDDVNENHLTPTQAAKKHGIPRTTLTDKIKGKSQVNARNGRPHILSKEEEESLVFYIKYRVDRGFPISKKAILSLALATHLRHCEEMGMTPKVNRKKGLSQKWWKGFKCRNNLTIRKPSPLDRGRKDAVDEKVVKEFFELYRTRISDNGLTGQAHRVYNVDETGFDLDPQKKNVVTFKKMGAPAASVRKGTRDHISTMECVSADGGVIPPLIIFSKAYPSSAYRLEGPDNAVYATTSSGFIEGDIFVQWLERCFCRFSSQEKPVLLLMDQHSAHVTPKAIDCAIANDIILMGLPPHTSHFLQPLDAPGGPFNTMKSTFEDVVNEMRLVRPNFFMTKSTFPRVYKVVREKSLSMAVVKTGFRKTGVFPIDQSQINNRWLTLNSLEVAVGEENSADNMVEEEVEESQDTCTYQLLPEEEEILQMAKELADQEEVVSNETTKKVLPVHVTSPTSEVYSANENPFVKAGIVPSYVADLLTPIQESRQRKVRRVKPRAIVFDEKYIADLRKEAEEKEERKVKEQMKRKEEREEKKERKVKEQMKRKEEREEKKRKKTEEMEMKRAERLQKKQKQQKKSNKPSAGTSLSSTSPAEAAARPRRVAKRPLWMEDFTTESTEDEG
ncbi:PREDICTED: tigger transposable element-derived protein 6-like [Branchiostoma belcheri]|uniref:Tigger transposable element-derived protein 6-like n=1 Tax=Branchiostoma belcheri TaxID=7741 RepID=A0A6P4Z494_BRABE|nr:PREDICTED: tigger transposable element-derived protein 6-like [Branchiostoma belcheri]